MHGLCGRLKRSGGGGERDGQKESCFGYQENIEYIEKKWLDKRGEILREGNKTRENARNGILKDWVVRVHLRND